jgi:hypothetical protein
MLNDEQMCPNCHISLGEGGGKCPECGWLNDAIVLRADAGALRANAQSAANERRIVAIDADSPKLISGNE